MNMKPISMTISAVSVVAATLLTGGLAMASDTSNHFTGNSISLDPQSPSYFENFAPELASSIERKPTLDPETGLSVSEVKPGLFFVTDGMYQSAFLATNEGIVVFDAPLTFAERLPQAIKTALPGKNITHLIYSHDHADHIGGSGVFADVAGLEVIATQGGADSLVHDAYAGALLPTRTFEDALMLTVGGIDIQLDAASYHSEDQDLIAYIPSLKFLIAVDTITPAEVPFMNFGATSDFGRYAEVFDTLLDYDFDLIMTGHISILGNRQDVIENRDYTYDVRDTVLQEMQEMFPKFFEFSEATNHVNGNLAYRMAIEDMRNECAAQIIDRWADKLSVVDIYADSHCQTAILYYIMH